MKFSTEGKEVELRGIIGKLGKIICYEPSSRKDRKYRSTP